MKITHLLIFGKVHGVGFRKYIKHNGTKLGLKGWVRNLPEGTVEAEVSGSEEQVGRLISLAKKGPFLAEVTNVEIQEHEKDFPYEEFLLRHDID